MRTGADILAILQQRGYGECWTHADQESRNWWIEQLRYEPPQTIAESFIAQVEGENR